MCYVYGNCDSLCIFIFVFVALLTTDWMFLMFLALLLFYAGQLFELVVNNCSGVSQVVFVTSHSILRISICFSMKELKERLKGFGITLF